MKSYVNGELDAEKPLTEGVLQFDSFGATFLGLASASNRPYFWGAIDAIRISNKALTEFQIQKKTP